MYQRLRLRFLVMAALALALALGLFSSVLTSAYRYNTRQQVENVLEILANNDGQLTYNTKTSEKLGFRSPDDLYQYRYFSIILDTDGKIESSTTDNIQSISKTDLIDLAEEIIELKEDRGEVRHNRATYSYQIRELDDDQRLLVILDSTQFYLSTMRLTNLTYLMSLVSFVVFLLIFSLFLKRIIRPFVRNMEKQRRFVTNAGHELKTPIAIIQANTELQEMMTGENEWSQSTKDQVARLTSLINGMVAMARLEEQPDLVLSDQDLSAITEDAAEDFKGPVVRDGKTFTMDIEPDIHIMAEETSLFELVTILVDNANKYCDDQGQVTVKLSQVGRTRKRARLEISNTYKEGKDVDYSKFFERFYRDDQSHHASNEKGFGIGLSMAQNMVKLFKGRIKASYKNDTITFTITFPKVS